jgi:phosphohistidine phosphatase
MDLILWRHTEAHPQRDGQPDLERALTPRVSGRRSGWAIG